MTKVAFKLALQGFKVKEPNGGLDFWLRDGHPLAIGESRGSLVGQTLADCGCS
ncbi:hypothetical protein ACQKDS_10115 [Serratia sp. NPDC078593]|uniref:hypothetical protein n=1 Tax=unclassified Serratia (in: enterobacteria) TaxID=2647522 RepID=UPI0037CE7219